MHSPLSITLSSVVSLLSDTSSGGLFPVIVGLSAAEASTVRRAVGPQSPLPDRVGSVAASCHVAADRKRSAERSRSRSAVRFSTVRLIRSRRTLVLSDLYERLIRSDRYDCSPPVGTPSRRPVAAGPSVAAGRTPAAVVVAGRGGRGTLDDRRMTRPRRSSHQDRRGYDQPRRTLECMATTDGRRVAPPGGADRPDGLGRRAFTLRIPRTPFAGGGDEACQLERDPRDVGP